MATVLKPNLENLFLDKKAIQKMIAAQNKDMGFAPDPDATPQTVRARMVEMGVRPEDNIGSTAIIEAREGE